MLNTDTFKRGTMDLVVLAVLRERDMYGYEIVKAVSDKSGGRYRFVENGYVSDRDEIVQKRLRKYYHLEDAGKFYYAALLEEYRRISRGVAQLLGGGSVDESAKAI